MADQLPQGFKAAGVYSGVKSDEASLDLSLIVSEQPAVAAGVFTQNLVQGAPVRLNRSRTPSESIRGVVINSGISNACTGTRGDNDAAEMARLLGAACGFNGDHALVLSTGLIGDFLPMEKIATGISLAAKELNSSEAALVDAARGMMTTDTCHKLCSRRIELEQPVCVTGMAKGAAMIGPNMATMLAVVVTDASLSIEDAQGCLRDAVDESFNCISVDGHMSTSDCVLLLANGAAGGPVLRGADLAKFQATLVEVCEYLAQSIPC